VYRFGDWRAEFLQDFDVRRLMREVTLDGPDAQLAFDDYMGEVRVHISLQDCVFCMLECCCLLECGWQQLQGLGYAAGWVCMWTACKVINP
jgi:hypothetical protein